MTKDSKEPSDKVSNGPSRKPIRVRPLIRKVESKTEKSSHMGKSKTLAKLDLHGKKVDEVFDLVDQFITRNAHKPRVQIIPGKGTGAVKKELLRYLKLGGYPWEYETLSNGNKNTGSMIIILAD